MRLCPVVATTLALGSIALLVYWLRRGERPPVPVGAIVLAAASLLTLVAPAPHRRRRRAGVDPDQRAEVATRRTIPILVLLVLSALGAELLAAYDDTTGRPGAIAFAASSSPRSTAVPHYSSASSRDAPGMAGRRW